MSGATKAMEELRAALEAPLRAVAATVSQARGAQAEMRMADDIMPMLAAASHVTLAMEALQNAAKEAETASRSALAAVMSDIGCTSFHSIAHVVSLKEAARSVLLTDEKAIPPEFWTTPEPRPDKKALAQALAVGPVGGATFSNRPPPIVQIKARKAP